jgi:hypothetical protein
MSPPPRYEGLVAYPSSPGVQRVADESYISSKSVYEVEGESAPLAAALALDKPKILSKQMFRLYVVCLLAYLSTYLSFLADYRLLYKWF